MPYDFDVLSASLLWRGSVTAALPLTVKNYNDKGRASRLLAAIASMKKRHQGRLWIVLS